MLTYHLDADSELFLFMPHHAEAFFHLVDNNRAYWGEWLDWIPRMTDVEAARAFLQRGLDELAGGTAIRMGIRHKGEIVGRMFFSNINHYLRKCEIGGALDQRITGGGIITRATLALLDYGFGEMGMRKIEIVAAEHNTRTRAIAERFGFLQEGTLRNTELVNGQYQHMVFYGMLAEDWPKARATLRL